MGSVYLRGDRYWIKYYKDGKPIRESSGSTKKSEAVKLMKEREGRVARGEPLSLRVERITVDELLSDVLADYETNNKGIDRAKLSVSKLKAFFGGMRAVALTTSHVNSYIAKRKGETTLRGVPPSPATINRELSLLKRAYNLARHSTPSKVHQVPHIPLLREDNIRTGFVEYQDCQALKAAAPEYLKSIITMAYHTGCRKSEILNLRWSQVDLKQRLIRLNPGETKNRDGRTIYMGAELYEALAELKAQRDWDRPHCETVFVRDGQPIKSFKKAWQTACVAVGLGKKEERSVKKGRERKVYRYEGLLFHDLRRSAIRNLVRSGVPERVAMAISGHRTRSVFDRYNVTSEQDLEQAAQALDAYHASMGTISADVEVAERIIEDVQGNY
ncbi:MAG: tyrosine-type recombinase/integrase [Nitrospinae bacterium]|nr:tyrosine-type recombinase/integrase [Nitrospinota bacterium]